MNDQEVTETEPTVEELEKLEAELEDEDYIEDEELSLFDHRILRDEDFYEGESIELHNRISYKGIRLA